MTETCGLDCLLKGRIESVHEEKATGVSVTHNSSHKLSYWSCSEQSEGRRAHLKTFWRSLREESVSLVPHHLPLLLLLRLSFAHLLVLSLPVAPSREEESTFSLVCEPAYRVTERLTHLQYLDTPRLCFPACQQIFCSPSDAFLSVTAYNQSLRHWFLLISLTWRTSLFDKSEEAEAVRGQTALLLLFVILHRSYFIYNQPDILSLLYMNVRICCFVFPAFVLLKMPHRVNICDVCWLTHEAFTVINKHMRRDQILTAATLTYLSRINTGVRNVRGGKASVSIRHISYLQNIHRAL